jgi:hypothetical protein
MKVHAASLRTLACCAALGAAVTPAALYPDPVLSQMLIASTNPQEVLDTGNWLLQCQSLKGNALDDAAAAPQL